ncbi:MAG: replication-relaxation family protein [Candidatus Eremiobacteraeota bacterium]|nr:replication-relaxation family protein [Candidatus Eremiobacteraeota bacterium]
MPNTPFSGCFGIVHFEDLAMFQLRDIDVLESVARYRTLTRAQINRLHFPTDAEGRLTRKRLRLLHDEGMVNRTNMQVVNPSMGAPAYVYYPSAKGCAFLLQEQKDDWYKTVCTLTPNWMYLYHWVEVAQTHITLDQAVVRLPGVKVIEWISEWSIANAAETEPEYRYKLYTRLGQKLVCAPDAAFLLQKDGFRKAFYLEQDRDTTKNAERVAAQKCHGFAALFERRAHIGRHFPLANVEKFTVLFVAPSTKRRDALRKAFAEKPAAWLYKFAAQPDLKPETFLTEPIWFPCCGEPDALVKEGGDK